MLKKNKNDIAKMLFKTKLIIFDIDKTLAVPNNSDYYKQHYSAVERAISIYYKVEHKEAYLIAQESRLKRGGGEFALFSPEKKYNKSPNFDILYNQFEKIKANSSFDKNLKIINLLNKLKEKNIKIVGLTNTTDSLAKRTLLLVGLDPDKTFDELIGYTKKNGPPKTMKGSRIFTKIVKHFSVKSSETLSIGDSYKNDILPAIKVGLTTCLISNKPPNEYNSYYIESVEKLSEILPLP